MKEAKRIFNHKAGLSFADGPNQALDNADALVVVTEWKEFRSPDFTLLKQQLKSNIIFDGRNIYDPKMVKSAGIKYCPIGRVVT